MQIEVERNTVIRLSLSETDVLQVLEDPRDLQNALRSQLHIPPIVVAKKNRVKRGRKAQAKTARIPKRPRKTDRNCPGCGKLLKAQGYGPHVAKCRQYKNKIDALEIVE